MKKTLSYVAALSCALVLAGCGDNKKTTTGDPTKAHPAAYEICDKCGEVEDSINCCETGEGITACKKCGRHEGSPGCCQKGHHIHLCKECGIVYDGDEKHACNITKKCEKCGRQHGSPGCCLVVVMKKDKDKAEKTADKTEKTEKTDTKTKTE